MTAAAVRVPASPAGEQLDWVLALVAAGAPPATRADVDAHFAPSFFEESPADELVTTLAELPALLSGAALRRVREKAAHELIADVDSPAQGLLRVELAVETDAPHRITTFELGLAPNPAAGAAAVAWADIGSGDEGGNIDELSADVSAALDRLVRIARDDLKIVGLAAAVIRDGSLAWFRGLGWADAASRTPVRTDTVFRIGSVSKTITALGVMQLVEQGRIGLDDDVNQHLTAYRVDGLDGVPITARHLLTHSSGLTPRPVAIGVDRGEPVPALRDYYKDGLRGTNAVGSPHVYSNDGFATLGQLVEDVSGQSFEQYMVDHVFEPLGMHRSDYVLSERVGSEPATGYDHDLDEIVTTTYRDVIVRAAGSVFSTIDDMAEYIAAVNGGGANRHGRVVEASTLETMFAQQGELPPAMADAGLHQGLGFLVWDLGGHRVPWHNGGWPGAATSTWAAVDDGVGVQLFSNVFSGTVSPGLDALGKNMMGALLGR